MTLSMSNHVSGDLLSGTVEFVKKKRTFVDGIEQGSIVSRTRYSANIQPLNAKERSSLGQGLERVVDYRKVYINSGDLSKLDCLDDGTGYIVYNNREWKIISSDIRISRSYCKLIIARKDT